MRRGITLATLPPRLARRDRRGVTLRSVLILAGLIFLVAWGFWQLAIWNAGGRTKVGRHQPTIAE